MYCCMYEYIWPYVYERCVCYFNHYMRWNSKPKKKRLLCVACKYHLLSMRMCMFLQYQHYWFEIAKTLYLLHVFWLFSTIKKTSFRMSFVLKRGHERQKPWNLSIPTNNVHHLTFKPSEISFNLEMQRNDVMNSI